MKSDKIWRQKLGHSLTDMAWGWGGDGRKGSRRSGWDPHF